MRTFKKTKQAATWTLELTLHNSRRARFAGMKDRRATEALGRMIAKLSEARGSGADLGRDVLRWLEGIPPRLRDRLMALDLLDRDHAARGMPLSEHLDHWTEHLRAKGTTAKQTRLLRSRCEKVFDRCGWTWWSECNARQAEQCLTELRGAGMSLRTSGFYRQALRQFARWMLVNRRAVENPFDALPSMNPATDPRHERRALTDDEVTRLLRATRAAVKRFKMSGTERALLYETALQTGLRASELRTLTGADLDFNSLTVTVQACYSKHRRQDTLPLRRDLAAKLAEHVQGRSPQAPVFTMPYPSAVCRMLKKDLAEAGIVYKDDAGRVADFHALRHTFVTNLVRSGAGVKTAQTLARHSTPVLTLGVYSHVGLTDTRAAVEKLDGYDAKQTGQTRETA